MSKSRGILDEYPMRYYECRDVGHAWEVPDVPGEETTRGRKKVVAETLICTRCVSTVYREVYRGEIIYRRYYYVEGYIQKGAVGQTRRDWRAARIERALRRFAA